MEPVTVEDIQGYQPERYKDVILHGENLITKLVEMRHATDDEVYGAMTINWPSFNRYFGGARGELVVVTADTNVGKSTFVRSWFVQLLANQVPSLMISLEDSVTQMSDAISQMIIGKDLRASTDEDMKKLIATFKKWPMYYLDYHGSVKDTFIEKAIHYAADVLKVKFIVIDHLDYIKKNWSGRNESYVIGDFMRMLAAAAHQAGICVCCVVHPAKRNDKSLTAKEVGIDELKGSSSIKQEAASVLGLHQPDPTKPDCYLRFLKIRNRHFARSRKGRVWFQFDSSRCCYRDQNREIEWAE